MSQQINLCTATFRPIRQRFSAQALLQAMGVLMVLGCSLVAAWVWSLEQSSAAYRKTTAGQLAEINNLKVAIAQSHAYAAPVDPALLAQLQDRRLAVVQREALVSVVQQGMFKAGEGHSDRLLMVSRSIPTSVWVSAVKIDAGRFEVDGFTLEPSALNEWVARLAAHPLMRHLQLTTVTVDNKAGVPARVSTAPASAPGGARAVWSFNLTNLEPPAPVLAGASASGGKP
jgi:Tfp pilus assembly protein PilN